MSSRTLIELQPRNYNRMIYHDWGTIELDSRPPRLPTTVADMHGLVRSIQ